MPRKYSLVLRVTPGGDILLSRWCGGSRWQPMRCTLEGARHAHRTDPRARRGLAMYGGLTRGLLVASRLAFPADPFPDGRLADTSGLLSGGRPDRRRRLHR